MKIVIFGLTISSSWGNGHATLWRGLLRALSRRGHSIAFFEKDVPYYASARDLTNFAEGELHIYPSWEMVKLTAREYVRKADVAIISSYCPDALAASEMLLEARRVCKVFYDLDTPITLSRHLAGNPIEYIGPEGLKNYDLVLSFTGGKALDELKAQLGAQQIEVLYGHVDPEFYVVGEPVQNYRADLSYIGTFSADRQAKVEALFVEPARQQPERRFVLAGAQYPSSFPWTPNIYFVRHVPPPQHSAFFSSCRTTLNVTRGPMASMGFCPSGRMFEAAACAAAIISDSWVGIEGFFEPGKEIFTAVNPSEVIEILQLPDNDLKAVGEAGRQRVLSQHTSDHRAMHLEEILSHVLATGSAN
ncbi:MAG: glycosyltransferase [Verrucomicrobia bacterium]|nr:glycosyltransferase [Verrucomicrobiota bacterium]MBV9671951.1 glycosyltransferase [Verrucomicrobiota bacterium]